MGTSEAKEIKKQETLVRFSIISYKTRLRVNIIKSLLGQWTFTETSYGKDVISIFSSGMSLIPWTSPQEQHYKTTLYRLRVSRDDEIQSNIPLYFKGKIISLPY